MGTARGHHCPLPCCHPYTAPDNIERPDAQLLTCASTLFSRSALVITTLFRGYFKLWSKSALWISVKVDRRAWGLGTSQIGTPSYKRLPQAPIIATL